MTLNTLDKATALLSKDQRSRLAHEVAGRIVSLKRNDENWTEFAGRIGLSPQVVSNFKNKHNGAGLDTVDTVAEEAGVSVRWLLLGDEGEDPAQRPPSEKEKALDQIAAIVLRIEDYVLAETDKSGNVKGGKKKLPKAKMRKVGKRPELVKDANQDPKD